MREEKSGVARFACVGGLQNSKLSLSVSNGSQAKCLTYLMGVMI